MPNPTLEQVKDFAAMNMIPEKIAETYWMNFECQDWYRANNQKIVKWQIHFKWWYQNECWKSKERKQDKKQKLLPIPGKHCSERGCQMPAVYKYTSDAGYDFYRCRKHLPEFVKKEYE